MQTYYTTSTGPGFGWTFADPSGNVPPSFNTASFSLKFRCTANFQKVSGGGTWGSPNGTTGQVTYTLGANDMANAYALFSSLIGSAFFEVFATATISGVEYDALPVVIQIQKI
jgi:hypothetical protein